MMEVWEDKGRKFRLDRRINGARGFVLCLVLDLRQRDFV